MPKRELSRSLTREEKAHLLAAAIQSGLALLIGLAGYLGYRQYRAYQIISQGDCIPSTRFDPDAWKTLVELNRAFPHGQIVTFINLPYYCPNP